MFDAAVSVPNLMSIREVAGVLKCSRGKVYNLTYSGELPVATVAGKTVCRAIDVRAYIVRCLEASGLSESDAAGSKPSDTSKLPGSDDGSATLLAHRRNKRLFG